MKFNILKLIVLFSVIAVISCNTGEKPTFSNKILEVLEEADSNKIELIKTINYYSEKEEDSLKLKATLFLIENMLGHSYAKTKLVDTTDNIVNFNVLDYKDYEQMVKAYDSLEMELGFLDFTRDTIIYDSKAITSEYLINNIDLAFQAWENPWSKQLNFTQFCEYILPYRGSNEPLEDWRSYFLTEYSWLKDSLKDILDPVEAASLINNNLISWFNFDARLYRHPTDLGLQEMLDTKVGRCEDMTNLAIYAMRANGIPVMSDYVTHWPTSGNNHAWNSTFDKNGNIVIFMGCESNPHDYKLNNKKAKVYRKSFSIQDSSLKKIKPEYEKIPRWLSGSHVIDVTKEYIPVVNFTQDFNQNDIDSINYGYLCVFNSGKWSATAWGKFNKGKNKVLFKDVGMDILYNIAFVKGDTLNFIQQAFILDTLGKLNFIEPDTTKLFKYSFYATTKRIIIKTTDEIRKSHFADKTNYELYYWNNKWNLIGTETAIKDKPLVFDNIPENALYWLKIKDGKKEERIFTIKNGEQIWW